MIEMIKGGGRTRKAAGTPAAYNICLCHYQSPGPLDSGLIFKTVLGIFVNDRIKGGTFCSRGDN